MLSVGDCAVEGLGFVDEDSCSWQRSGAVLESKDSRSASQLAMASRGLGSGERGWAELFEEADYSGANVHSRHVDSGAGD